MVLAAACAFAAHRAALRMQATIVAFVPRRIGFQLDDATGPEPAGNLVINSREIASAVVVIGAIKCQRLAAGQVYEVPMQRHPALPILACGARDVPEAAAVDVMGVMCMVCTNTSS